MLSFKEYILEGQEHTSADTSLNQASAGLKYAVKNNLIKPHTHNIDNGGGKYDEGKKHVESNIEGAKLHVHDPYNRPAEHNEELQKNHTGKAPYVGMHNVLNVIKEPDERIKALQKTKSFMHPKGIVHISVHEGDGDGNARITKADKGRGSSWQEHRKTETYMPEVRSVFPDDTHTVERKGKNILVRGKE